jgi:hypothetical protein
MKYYGTLIKLREEEDQKKIAELTTNEQYKEWVVAVEDCFVNRTGLVFDYLKVDIKKFERFVAIFNLSRNGIVIKPYYTSNGLIYNVSAEGDE